jgi:predicted nuclease with TOPRIM domain
MTDNQAIKKMEIKLIDGEFSTKESLELITKMIHIKIKYHETKITEKSTEEDIKWRETKIKRLQKELYDLRKNWAENYRELNLNATIKIEQISL